MPAEKDQPSKDTWDRIEILSKFAVAVVVAIIAFAGNNFLDKKQTMDSNMKLYTQLLANKESSENTLRKDMFAKILESFLAPGKEKEATNKKKIEEIRESSLRLELLSRNFHEFLDMKPLFKHILMEIILPRVALMQLKAALKKKRGKIELMAELEKINEKSYSQAEIEMLAKKIIKWAKINEPMPNILSLKGKELIDALKTKLNSVPVDYTVFRTAKRAFKATNDVEVKWEHPGNRFENDLEALTDRRIGMVENILRRYDRELEKLISIAKRVTRKQREILEDVSGKLSLSIPLQGDLSDAVCQTIRPIDGFPEQEGECPASERRTTRSLGKKAKTEGDADRIVPGIQKEMELTYFDSKKQEVEDSKRFFAVNVRYAYTRWKQVYVEITTSPQKGGYENWLSVKEEKARCLIELKWQSLEGGTSNCVQALYDKYNIKIDNDQQKQLQLQEFLSLFKEENGIETAKFWLEYFDFPLVDNSYINSKQRYSVILEDVVAGSDGQDDRAEITLLYYPASYSSLKEKSFYNNQLMQYLMKQDFFTKAALPTWWSDSGANCGP